MSKIPYSNPTGSYTWLISGDEATYTNLTGANIVCPLTGTITDIEGDSIKIEHYSENNDCKFTTKINNVNFNPNVSKRNSVSQGFSLGMAKGAITLQIIKGLSKVGKDELTKYLGGNAECDDSTSKTTTSSSGSKSSRTLKYNPYEISAHMGGFGLVSGGIDSFKKVFLNTSYENHKEIVEEIERIKQLLK
jgi:hypothetical protein